MEFERRYDVRTTHGNLAKELQMEGHPNMRSIYRLCKKLEIDLTDKFIVGFGLIDGSSESESGKLALALFTIDSKKFGNDYNKIERNIQSNPRGTIQLTKTIVWIPYADFCKYIRYFDFLITSSLLRDVDQIDIVD